MAVTARSIVAGTIKARIREAKDRLLHRFRTSSKLPLANENLQHENGLMLRSSEKRGADPLQARWSVPGDSGRVRVGATDSGVSTLHSRELRYVAGVADKIILQENIEVWYEPLIRRDPKVRFGVIKGRPVFIPTSCGSIQPTSTKHCQIHGPI
jgi:hypothetical protein